MQLAPSARAHTDLTPALQAAQKAGVVGPLLHLCCQDGVDSRIQHLALQALAAALLCPPARDEVATARGCAFLCQQLSHTGLLLPGPLIVLA